MPGADRWRISNLPVRIVVADGKESGVQSGAQQSEGRREKPCSNPVKPVLRGD